MYSRGICAVGAAVFLLTTPANALSVYATDTNGVLSSNSQFGGSKIIGKLKENGHALAPNFDQTGAPGKITANYMLDDLGFRKGVMQLSSFWSATDAASVTDAFAVTTTASKNTIPKTPLPASLVVLLSGLAALLWAGTAKKRRA